MASAWGDAWGTSWADNWSAPAQQTDTAERGGAFYFHPPRLPPARERVDARAAGAILTVRLELVAGEARGQARTRGNVSLPGLSSQLIAGAARGSAAANGRQIIAAAELLPGRGHGGARARGDRLLLQRDFDQVAHDNAFLLAS